MAYLKNWIDNFFQIFFMGTSWVAVSINNIKIRASSEMTSRKNIKIFYCNGVNVAKHWHVAGEVFAISDCLVVDCSHGWFLNSLCFLHQVILAFPHARIPYVICGWSNEKYSVCKLSMGRENFTCLITNRAFGNDSLWQTDRSYTWTCKILGLHYDIILLYMIMELGTKEFLYRTVLHDGTLSLLPDLMKT